VENNLERNFYLHYVIANPGRLLAIIMAAGEGKREMAA